ncbi:MAG: GNAT family N-acetyltransferase [Bacteroidia bacterium]|nr:GNAT family N-acetyltransferase [Bacteroidia bacterium]
MAVRKDARKIAELHARSWQEHYRGLWPDEFLDKHVLDNRLETWHGRFAEENESRRIMTAWQGDLLIGFCCTFLDRDDIHGALLDNLHVSSQVQGKGIGRQLMADAAGWVIENRSNSHLYLWVLEGNHGAIKFYEKLGGVRGIRKADDIPTGGQSWIYRYSWQDPSILIR